MVGAASPFPFSVIALVLPCLDLDIQTMHCFASELSSVPSARLRGMTVALPTDRATDSASTGRPTYLDFNATAPVDPRVAEEVLTFMSYEFGNAGSRSHSYGQIA